MLQQSAGAYCTCGGRNDERKAPKDLAAYRQRYGAAEDEWLWLRFALSWMMSDTFDSVTEMTWDSTLDSRSYSIGGMVTNSNIVWVSKNKSNPIRLVFCLGSAAFLRIVKRHLLFAQRMVMRCKKAPLSQQNVVVGGFADPRTGYGGGASSGESVMLSRLAKNKLYRL